MSVLPKITFLVGMLFSSHFLLAQSDRVVCIQNLSRAQRLYEEGELLKAISLIEDCAQEDNFEKNQLEEAHKLLVLCYTFLDKSGKAQEEYRKLLGVNPNYIPNVATEPVELVQLHNSFRTNPIVSFGLVLGGNLSSPIINVESKEIFKADGLRESNRTASARIGTRFGIMGELQLHSNFAINAKLLLSSIKYQLSENLFDGDQLVFDESQSWIEFPLAFRYYAGRKNKSRFFLEAGLTGRLLRNSKASVQRLVVNGADVSGPDIDISNSRMQTNYAYIFGAGLRRSLGNILLSATISAQYDTSQQVDKGQRYANQELLFRYGYVDEDFKVLTPSVSITISYAIYRHKIVKRR
jgi:tetratricopeptide (TPR) repeat protein